MIETLLHFIRLAFATSALWTLDPSVAPSSSNANALFFDGSTNLFIGTNSTAGRLIIQNDAAHVLVTCRAHTERGRTTYDRCEVTP